MKRLTVDISEAETSLSELIGMLDGDTEIVIVRRGRAVARLLPPAVHPRPDRVPGSAKGMFTVPKDFDAPLDDFRDYT